MNQSRTALSLLLIPLALAACSADSGSLGSTSSSAPGMGGTSATRTGAGVGGTGGIGVGGKSAVGAGGAPATGHGGATSPGHGGTGQGGTSAGQGGTQPTGQGGTQPTGQGGAATAQGGTAAQGGDTNAGEGGTSAGGPGGMGDGGASAGSGTGGSTECNFPPLPCSPDEIAAAHLIAISQPIVPPRFAAGVDFLGPLGTGTPLEQLEAGFRRVDYATPAIVYPGQCMRLCQDAAAGLPEIDFHVDTPPSPSGILNATLAAGYLGVMTMVSRPGGSWGTHTYVVAPGKMITRDAAPVSLSWDIATEKDPSGIFSELYDALIYTFAPYLPPLGGTQSCSGSTCRFDAFIDSRSWVLLDLGVVFHAELAGDDPTAASTIASIDTYGTRLLGFSRSHVRLGIGAGLPTISAGPLGPALSSCDVSLGMTVGSFLSSCVNVTGSALGDSHEMEKLYVGLRRGAETYSTTTEGVAIGAHAQTLGPSEVVGADQLPSTSDVVGALTFESFLPQDISNDHVGNDPAAPLDRHGIGLVYLEYARMIQAVLQDARTDVCADAANCPPGQAPRRTLGDPACLHPNVSVDPTGDPVFQQGCTGFEGFVTTAPVPTQSPPEEPYLAAVSVPSLLGWPLGEIPTLGPGFVPVAFCVQLAKQAVSECEPKYGGAFGGLVVEMSHDRVLSAVHGNPSALPPEMRDMVYFARVYATALVKYLVASAAGNETAEAVHAVPIVVSDIVIDSSYALPSGAPGWDLQYVAHNLAAPGTAPTTLHVVFDIYGQTDSYTFSNYLERGESAVYTVAKQPGGILAGAGDDASLTTVFGSPILDAIWGSEPPGCAIGTGSGCTVGPPLDESGAISLDEHGAPLLTRYASSIGHPGPLTLGHIAISLGSQVVVPPAPPFTNVSFPATAFPAFDELLPGYAATANAFTTPKGGFDAAFLSFTGTTMDAELAYLHGTPTMFPGVRSDRFEGRVFLCFDPISKTLLSASHGDLIEPLAAWIDAHPSAATACGVSHDMVTDEVISLTGAVGLARDPVWVEQARVGQVTLWDPSVMP